MTLAIGTMIDTELMERKPTDKDNDIRFKKAGDFFSLSILDGDKVATTKLGLMKLLSVEENKKKVAEKTAVTVNLSNIIPCKVSYVDIDSKKGMFVILNIFTDKLDYFEKEMPQEEKLNKIRILLLSMIIEVYNCTNFIGHQMMEENNGVISE